MSSVSDEEYFASRAVAEHALAEEATSADVSRIHEELAKGYEVLVRQAQWRKRSADHSRLLAQHAAPKAGRGLA